MTPKQFDELLVAEDHVLARKEVLKRQDLGDSHWVLFDKRIHPSLYESVMLIARDGGFRPKDVHHILHADEAEHLLVANGGVAFLTKSQALRIATRGLVAKPLDEDSLRLDEHLAARADNPSKLVSEFVRAFVKRMKDVLQPHQLSLLIGSDRSPRQY